MVFSNANLIKPKRAIAIDYFKSYLVIGMILAHTISLLYGSNTSLAGMVLHGTVTVINLISFSGFFFCFGYVNFKSYLTKPFDDVKRKMIRNAIRILLAYYISAFASAIFLSNFKFEIGGSLRILTFMEMPGYSEFLISFFLVTLLSILFFTPLKKAIALSWAFPLMIVISLLSSLLIPYPLITNNQIGLFIGTNRFTGFPVMQYLCYFLTGVLFAKYDWKYSWKILTISLIASLPFFTTLVITHHLPPRFPPGILWITGAAFLLYIYYYFSLRSEVWFGPENSILSIGHNTLFYLLLSNIFLFALADHFRKDVSLNHNVVGLIYLSVMSVIYYLSTNVLPSANRR